MARRERVTASGTGISRRKLLAGAAVAGGLAVAWVLWPRTYAGILQPGENEYGFGAWLTVGSDGVVTIAVPQLEMGQGVTTILPQLVAGELGADWRQVAVLPVPPNGAQPNAVLAARWESLWNPLPSLGEEADDFLIERYAHRQAFGATAEGTTLAAYETPAREAGAAARAMLAMAAAERWGVQWEECEVQGGIVMQGANRATFGELAAEAAAMTPPDPPPLRPEPPAEIPGPEGADAPLLYPRLDLPAKIDGSMVFAGDVRLPGMLHASIRHGPVGLPIFDTFDAEAAARVRGVRGVVKSKRWIAAAADSWWQADRALTAMSPRFRGEKSVDSAPLLDILARAAGTAGQAIYTRGNAAASLADGNAVFTATSRIAPAIHAALEPTSATARFADGRLELWAASQAPTIARDAAAAAVGISPAKVEFYPLPAGGSFDARLEKQHVIEVAQLAKELGRPVQLTWPRGEEAKALPPRTPVAIAITAKLDPASALPLAWQTRIACPATTREFGARLFDNATAEAAMQAASGQADPLACEGAVPPYRIADIAVEHVPVTLPLPTARLRGNAAAYTAFATETFIDELAARAGRDPLLYRLELLGREPRLAAILQRAGRLAEWDGGSAGSGQGLALVRMDDPVPQGAGAAQGGGFIVCVAKARAAEGGLRVDRFTAVVDIGRIVNLDIARQQIEGGLLFGLGLSVGQSPVWIEGQPRPAGFGGLGLPTLATAPEILVEFVPSNAPPFDPGEMGVAVAPPAIANALFAATGRRSRTLPLIETATLIESPTA